MLDANGRLPVREGVREDENVGFFVCSNGLLALACGARAHEADEANVISRRRQTAKVPGWTDDDALEQRRNAARPHTTG